MECMLTHIVNFFQNHRCRILSFSTVHQTFCIQVWNAYDSTFIEMKYLAGKWILHHDNAFPHRTFGKVIFGQKRNTSFGTYLPDLAVCDFFMFQELKISSKGSHLEFLEGVEREIPRVMD